MPPTPPQDPGSRQPSVPPPQAKKRPAQKPQPTSRATDTQAVTIGSPDIAANVDGEVDIPAAAPVHRQYLDRTTTTSVITLGYCPTKAMARHVYWVGLGMAAVALVAAIPAFRFLSFADAPVWARLVLLISTIQLAYVAWMCLAPDWSTVRSTMFVFAGVAAAYGFAMAVAIATPPGGRVMFEMGTVHSVAARWCGIVMALLAVATFFSGRLAFRWRKAYLAANDV